jgi:3-oxoacyl-[acyl-carrier protein] reductase
VLELDLMVLMAAEIVVKKTLDRFGRIDALVNIAGAVAGLDRPPSGGPSVMLV